MATIKELRLKCADLLQADRAADEPTARALVSAIGQLSSAQLQALRVVADPHAGSQERADALQLGRELAARCSDLGRLLRATLRVSREAGRERDLAAIASWPAV